MFATSFRIVVRNDFTEKHKLKTQKQLSSMFTGIPVNTRPVVPGQGLINSLAPSKKIKAFFDFQVAARQFDGLAVSANRFLAAGKEIFLHGEKETVREPLKVDDLRI